MGAMKLDEVVSFLDRELDIAAFSDVSNNGLQVANPGTVSRVCCGVDASLEFFEAAAAKGADMVVVHHGMSWGDSLKRVTGLNYRLVSFLVRHDIALYACHLPLDAHPSLGNNARLAALLGLRDIAPFGTYHGQKIGFKGVFPEALPYPAVRDLVASSISPNLAEMKFGSEMVRSVGIVSGGASDMVEEAAAEGLDLFLSGEASLVGYNLARHLSINAIGAGHYATERFGVEAVGGLLAKTFGIPAELIDFNLTY